MSIRELRPDERDAWVRLRAALWPDEAPEDLAREAGAILADPRQRVLVAVDAADAPVGFVEVALRDVAEGCDDTPVGYVEGWFVAAEHRRAGIGRALIRAAEAWARSQGCRAIASDTEVENRVSRDAHRALGFVEVARLVHFAKRLEP